MNLGEAGFNFITKRLADSTKIASLQFGNLLIYTKPIAHKARISPDS